MMQVGHIELSATGVIRRVDDSMCDMISRSAPSLIGQSVLDITYAPDRDTCRRCMRTLSQTREPFAVIKRMLHADGSPLWVANTMAIAAFGDTPEAVMATITRATDVSDATAPPELLRQARLLLGDLGDRRRSMDTAMFVDPPSSILLSAYIAEAEGSVAEIDAMTDHAGVAKGVLVRWMRAMADEGLIEAEGDVAPSADVFGYRLTEKAFDRCETYLMRRVRMQKISLVRA